LTIFTLYFPRKEFDTGSHKIASHNFQAAPKCLLFHYHSVGPSTPMWLRAMGTRPALDNDWAGPWPIALDDDGRWSWSPFNDDSWWSWIDYYGWWSGLLDHDCWAAPDAVAGTAEVVVVSDAAIILMPRLLAELRWWFAWRRI